MIDIISFAISDFSRAFLELANQKFVSFKSQYILETLSFVGKDFTSNITHESNNDATGIASMTSYMTDNFERFGNYLSIDIMRSSVYNAKNSIILHQS